MEIQGTFWHLVLGLVLLAATEATTITKPGCQDRCGNVSIPYPFGTTEDCCYSNEFLITCNDSFDPPKVFLQSDNINVRDISIEGKLRIMQSIAHDCYDESGAPVSSNNPRLLLADFIVSDTDNKFVAIGCDTKGYIKGVQGDRGYTTGCITICDGLDYVANYTCSGVGCCQTSVARGVSYFDVAVSSFSNHSNIWHFNPCSYAFVVEEAQFNFSPSYLHDLRDVDKFPVVLDWSIGNYTCEEAKLKMTASACLGKSTCYDVDNGSGYRCKCLNGYEGHPYLPNGCQDIDECKDPNLNKCEKICENTERIYTCLCPKGYHGDGRKDGQGCIADRSVVIPVAVGICTGVGLVFLLIGIWWLRKVLKRRRQIKLKEMFFKRNGGLLLQKKLCSDHEGDRGMQKIKLFHSDQLEIATDQYNENRILGCGGQGTVYKGMLPDGRIVAVKKSKMVNEGPLEQFINEILILSQIDHRNVVKLLGCCLETEVPLLVYEFIPNGTLFNFLHDQNEDFPRSWEMRFRIAIEVASAIYYLHSAASTPIYHRDIKSTNILLDEKFRPKVSDFGTSKSIDIDQTHLTTKVKGTFGYIDPEYFRSSQFTEKSDVYSFGVVLVELLTGQKPISSFGSQEKQGLVAYFISSMEENDHLLEILDPRVVKDGRKEELIAVANLARKCLNLEGRNRPTMKQVAMELERISMSEGHHIPAQPKQFESFVTKPYNEQYCDCDSTSSDIQPLIFNTI